MFATRLVFSFKSWTLFSNVLRLTVTWIASVALRLPRDAAVHSKCSRQPPGFTLDLSFGDRFPSAPKQSHALPPVAAAESRITYKLKYVLLCVKSVRLPPYLIDWIRATDATFHRHVGGFSFATCIASCVSQTQRSSEFTQTQRKRFWFNSVQISL